MTARRMIGLFGLPEFQDDLIVNAAKLNPRTIVVLHGGGGFNVQAWVNKVPALLHAWFPGQYGGQALAEILFGEVNPSGKLPITMEKRVQDNPAFATFPISDAECPGNQIFGRSFRGLSRLREKPHQASVSFRLWVVVHEISLLGYRSRPFPS